MDERDAKLGRGAIRGSYPRDWRLGCPALAVAAGQVGEVEISPVTAGIAKISVAQIGVHQRGPGEISPIEANAAQVGVREIPPRRSAPVKTSSRAS